MFCRSDRRACSLAALLVTTMAAVAVGDLPGPPAPPEPHSPSTCGVPHPPAPQAQLPPMPESRCQGRCGLLGSDAFASDVCSEGLPQCHPLPEIVPTQGHDRLLIFKEAAAPDRLIFAAPGPPLRPWQARTAERPRSPAAFVQPFTMHPFTLPDDVQYFAAGPYPVRVVPSVTPPPTSTDEAKPSPEELTPLHHLQRAADHLEAAGRGEAADQLRHECAEMRRQAGLRLQELRESKRKIEQEIEELERTCGLADLFCIRVSILEVDEEKLKQAGIRFEMPAATKSAKGLSTSSSSEAPVIAFDRRPTDAAAEQLDALRKCGAAKVLAEPVIVTGSGREASLFNGSQFPIQIPRDDGTISLEYQESGVRLTAMPQILEDGRLRLDIDTSVSERDLRNARVVNGVKVPGVIRRHINAQVEMELGETVVIGGLSVHGGAPAVPPILQKMPDHHRLFKQASHTSDEEPTVRTMVVFVTAEPVSNLPELPDR